MAEDTPPRQPDRSHYGVRVKYVEETSPPPESRQVEIAGKLVWIREGHKGQVASRAVRRRGSDPDTNTYSSLPEIWEAGVEVDRPTPTLPTLDGSGLANVAGASVVANTEDSSAETKGDAPLADREGRPSDRKQSARKDKGKGRAASVDPADGLRDEEHDGGTTPQVDLSGMPAPGGKSQSRARKGRIAAGTQSDPEDIQDDSADGEEGPESSKQNNDEDGLPDLANAADDPDFKPPRHITTPNPVPLLLHRFMAPYHGSKPIPADIRRMRNDIKRNWMTRGGRVKSSIADDPRYETYFNSSGMFLKGNPFREFYMDLRLFDEKVWDVMTIEHRRVDGRYKITTHVRLNDLGFPQLEGKAAQDVPKPASWNYNDDL